MRVNFVLTLTGPDRIGIVENVTGLLVARGGNVEVSRMARLGGEFAILMLVSIPVEHVADLRCSTPTEAGRRLVPDLAEEAERIGGLRDRARRALAGWVDREERLLAALRGRPVLADPLRAIDTRVVEVERLRDGGRACVVRGLDRRAAELEHVKARLTTLGPAATLARGYAVVQRVTDDEPLPVLRSVTEVSTGDRLRIRVADGAVVADVAEEDDAAGKAAAPARRRRTEASTT